MPYLRKPCHFTQRLVHDTPLLSVEEVDHDGQRYTHEAHHQIRQRQVEEEQLNICPLTMPTRSSDHTDDNSIPHDSEYNKDT